MARDYTEIDIAPYIDHALLHPSATPEQITQWCEQADQMHFASVCIAPAYVRQAADLLHGKSAKVCAVIGFPTGATTARVKLYEAQEAVENGARELDVVINIGLLKARKTEAVHREIAEICEETGVTVKAILETNLLTDEEKRIAAELCVDAGVEFLKTSTGWHGGATLADVRLLKELTKGQVGIKASGGIRTIEQAYEFVMAGATRLGTSRGPDLLHQRARLDQDTREQES